MNIKNILFIIALCLLASGCKNDNAADDGCKDCPCPDWVENELRYYREKTPPTLGFLFYMEKDGVPYYAIIDIASSSLTGDVRFFEADGTEIGKDHPEYETLVKDYLEGKFLFNSPCTWLD